MKMIRFKLTIVLPLLFLILSCADLETPPFVITTPVSELGNTSSDFTYAGISFSFMNTSDKTVSSITASFMLFDTSIQTNPFIGSNIFEIEMLTLILPGENKNIILSLDTFIHIAPSAPYHIDYFYISRIEYTDGSVWEDRFGTYRI
jgi:hypothetical protein